MIMLVATSEKKEQGGPEFRERKETKRKAAVALVIAVLRQDGDYVGFVTDREEIDDMAVRAYRAKLSKAIR